MSSSFIIIKNIQTINNTTVPVIILDGLGEVMEFPSKEKAEEMKEIFQTNSDSGHVYIIREIKQRNSSDK
jgi:hypothetical protein